MRRICIVTGSRADYGHLYWLMREVQADAGMQLQLVVTGAHLSARWGATHKTIEEDGFLIDAQVDMLLSNDTGVAACKAIGLAVIGLAEAFQRISPDLIVLLGDRFEVLAAAQTALLMRIPMAHIHGGETSEGAFDESIRHAVTKMAHLHFVANETYRQRVCQLGENPSHVFAFGAPGLDHLVRTPLADSRELEMFLKTRLDQPFVVVTYHPATLGALPPEEGARQLISALEEVQDVRIIFTGGNADPGNHGVEDLVQAFVAQHPDRAKLCQSLGQERYLGLVKIASAVVGNSSSGLIEAPALRVPTVNIGDRQKGRLKAVSVLDCAEDHTEIAAAIRKAISPEFRTTLPSVVSLYGGGAASTAIKEVLKSVDLASLRTKKFVDWGQP